jgi:hypothetical protein
LVDGAADLLGFDQLQDRGREPLQWPLRFATVSASTHFDIFAAGGNAF